MDKFKIYKAHKMLEWIENNVTEWAEELIENHFDVEIIELTQEQIYEVIDEWEEMMNYDQTLALGIRNCISIWENEHEEYLV